jgi:diguanylate cyclase (GGDEF)-like protein
MTLRKYLPGLDSYRGRYLYLSALAFVIFCSFAVINWNYIDKSSLTTRQNIIKRNENTLALNEIINQYQLIRIQIYQFSLNPEQVNPVDINDSTTRLINLTSNIDILLYDNIDATVLNNFIFQIPSQLHAATLDFIRTRTNPDLWIPALRVMTENLLPVNTEILVLLEEMIDDATIYNEQSKSLRMRLLELKNSWLSTVSEFRLLASNRMGIFDTSANSISSRVANIDLYINLSRKKLAAIDKMTLAQDYSYFRNSLFTELKQNISNWILIHEKAKSLLLDNNWRSDIPALKKIDSLLNEFNETLIALSNEQQKQTSLDIQSLNKNNRAYSVFFLVLGILLLIILIVIYTYIDRNVLRPITQTTRALLLQSKGISQELQLKSHTTETRQLIDAFNLMREQINQRENRLDFIAHHDNLTHLPNRLMFNERLEHAISLTQRGQKQVALMLLDLDRFKLVNDTLGHLFGDKLLQQTAQRLRECMRAEDTIARLGGDEFAIILENINSQDEIEAFARKIIKLFEPPFFIDDQELHASTSIGIALSPSDSSDINTLIRFTDIAMYESKNRGRNQYTFFSDDLEDSEESIINFENMLREALQQDQFELYYQSIIDIKNDEQLISEAFLRWNHPARGLLMPIDFIPVLDNSELLFELSCWVITHAQSFQSLVEQKLGVVPNISINLPSSIFQLKHYRDKFEQILLNDIKHPECFILEVTENTLITDMVNTAQVLNNLHTKGYRIALDDFGTGQSSLSHLRAFPIDTIKIDREFVRDVTRDQNDANLVSAIISLSHDMAISVIAEGVETQQQFDFLADKGCHLFQGFYFSKPMAASEYIKVLKNHPV